MQNYNEIITDKIIDYVDYILGRVTTNDEKERVIRINKTSIIPPENYSISELISQGLTYGCTILFNISVLNSEGNILTDGFEQELFVPIMINNTFIFEGKQRTPTQTLDNDFICRTYEGAIQINGGIRIVYDEHNHYVINIYTEDGDELSFDEPIVNKAFESEDLNILKYLKLTEYEQLKLKVKLDTDDIPELVTPELIQELIKFGPDRNKDSIIDKTIVTTEYSLISNLYRASTRRVILRNMRNKFYQYGNVFLKDIQNFIDRFFKVANEESIDIPNATNPLSYDSLRYKITIPKYIAYNETMADLIDPVNTPENANVNRINELNVCASIIDGIMYINCYTLEGEKVTMEYVRYLNHYVLQNTDYDYDNHQIIKRDQYVLKLRYHDIKVSDLSTIHNLLVEPKADEKLSITSRRVPLINMSDTVRVAMGCAMSKQSIEIEDSEIALVNSGNDDEDLVKTTLITRFNEDEGEVDKISGNKIFIKYPNGSVKYFEISQPTVGANDTVISFETNLKVGDKLNKGDVIVSPKIIKKGSYELGVNANAVYMNYLGLVHEDAFVISKSFADKITNYNIVETSIRVRKNSIVESLTKIGTRVKSLDILVRMKSKPRVGTIKSALEKSDYLMHPVSGKLMNDNLITPNNINEAYVVAVKIDPSGLPTESNVTEENIKDFNPKDTSHDWDDIPNKYKNLTLNTEPEFRGDDSYIITYKLLKVSRGMIGAKLCNRYGSKGEISAIIPDHLMPRMDEDGKGNGRPFDIIFNPPSVISRKNPSQLYELLITKVIYHIYGKVKELSKINLNEAKEYTRNVYGDKFTKLTDDEFLSLIDGGVTNFNLSVGSYSKISYDQLMSWVSEYGLEEKSNIYCPDIIISDSIDGKKFYDPMTTNINNVKSARLYELGFIEQPVVTGYTYIMKLYHSADYSGKVTPTNINAEAPYMGYGNYRSEGQKFGEMHVWGLMAHGAESLIRESNPRHDELQYEFLNELLLTGYAMVDDNGLPLLSKYRTSVNKLLESGNK